MCVFKNGIIDSRVMQTSKNSQNLFAVFLQEVSFSLTRIFHWIFRKDSCRLKVSVLAFSFLAGILSGAWLQVRSGLENVTLMRSIPGGAVSIVRLYLILFLPFLLVYASWLLDSVLVVPICFCRVFLFSYIHTGFAACFGQNAWALRWLALFSDMVSLPLFYYFCLQRIRGRQRGLAESFLFVPKLLVIGMIDFYIILPFYRAF